MKAKAVNELQNFERGLDPKKAMDIGRTPKRIVTEFANKLKEFGIEVEFEEATNYSNKELFDINFPDGPYSFASYASDKAAQEEWGTEEEPQEGGFVIYNKAGDEVVFGPSHDMGKVIKKIITAKYGNLKSIQLKIQKAKIGLKQLEELEELINKL